jgi:L-lactate dehydrogenase
MRTRSIGIVGTGWVGASVAISTLHSGIAEELLLFDARTEVAEGEALDLSHGSGFYPAATVRAVSALEQLHETDALVISAGRGGKPNETRLDLLRENAKIATEIATSLRNYRGVILVVANPVDVITRVIANTTGLPLERVIGTGTSLDTARLRQVLGRELKYSPNSIHAQVVGEHGDSEVVLWSSATVGGLPIRELKNWQTSREQELAREVRTAAHEIIRRKGATNHAIGLVTAGILKAVLRDERQVFTVSRVQVGTAELNDVALSLPSLVGAGGAVEVFNPRMSADEHERLLESARILQAAYNSIA